ncbi:MAG: metallophosphoesterase family protein [Deltaproteobacteria bacterium]|nr:metallophosphoesterase family protein [Deltaproteobacteria bacterium]
MTVGLRHLAALVLPASMGTAWVACKTPEAKTEPPPVQLYEGSGCSDERAAGFPYQPGCCNYPVDTPEVAARGFDSSVAGTSATPDHVHVSWAGPSQSSFAVNWRSDVDNERSQLLYGPSEQAVAAADGPGGDVRRVTGHHLLYASPVDGTSQTRVHEVHVCGLEPGTTYSYKVGGPEAWSEVYDAKTAPLPGATESFKFAVLGDSRGVAGADIHAQLQQAIATHDVDFELFTGDAVAAGPLQADWNRWFEATSGDFALQDLLARKPMFVANGNHENLALGLLTQFAVPQEISEGERAQGEEWYAFDYGNARFLVMSDDPRETATGQAQQDWLDTTLAAVDREQQPWLVLSHHRSLYSCGGSHSSDLDIRSVRQLVLDEHEVDLVVSGHDHLYERSKPMRGLAGTTGLIAPEMGPNDTPVNQSGTLYVVSGGAGAPLYGTDDGCDHTHLTESTYHYVIVEIADRQLSYTAYRLDGSVLDEFEITK